MMLLVVVTGDVDHRRAAAHSTNNEQLPVLVVGAGPCGLVAATTFQKHGISYTIVEKASRKKYVPMQAVDSNWLRPQSEF